MPRLRAIRSILSRFSVDVFIGTWVGHGAFMDVDLGKNNTILCLCG